MEKKFVCEYCGKSYETLEEMAECILKDSKVKKDEKFKKLEEEISCNYEKLQKLIKDFNSQSKEKEYKCTLETCSKFKAGKEIKSDSRTLEEFFKRVLGEENPFNEWGV